MTRLRGALLVLAALAPGAAQAAPDPDIGPWTAAERQILVPGSTLDGRAIVDLQPAGACRTRFVLQNGDVVVDGSQATDLIPHLAGNSEAIEIVQTGHHPTILVPDQKRGQLVFAGFVAVRDCLHAGS